MRRAILAAAFVVLAIAAAPHLQLDYASAISLPQLTVELSMPQGAGSDLSDITARWIEPIESAIRSLGEVTATRGEISTDSASITVRFQPGVDAEMKAARLTSELAAVRARLPADAALSVWPSQESSARPSAQFVMTSPGGTEAAERIANELRVVPGVREVDVYGGDDVETTVQLDRFANVSAAAVRDAITASVAPRAIGAVALGGRTFAITSAARTRRIEDVRVGGVPLGSIAEVCERRTPPRSLSRYNGKPAVLLEVKRDDGVPLFAFAAALRERANALGIEERWSEATEMRALLMRLGAGAIAAMLILAIGGAFLRGPRAAWLAFYVPLAIAISLNAARILGARIDVYTILFGAIAIAGMMPLALIGSRRAAIVSALFLALLPIAVALSSGQLAPLLETPARAFATTGLCAILAAALVRGPRGVGRRPAVPPDAGRRFIPRALRNSVSIVLAAVAISIFLFSWFGKSLDPRGAGKSIERGRLYLFLTFPGTTLATAANAVATVENGLSDERDIARFWSIVTPSQARITLELTDDAQSLRRLENFKLRLRWGLRLAPGHVRIAEVYQTGSGTSFSGDLEERPEADEEGLSYRVVLKSTRPDALQSVVDEMERRAVRLGLSRRSVRPEWSAGPTRIELVPRPATSFETATRVAAQIAERTRPPGIQRLPDGRLLRIIAAGAPVSNEQGPQRADLFARAFDGGTIPALFTPRTTTLVGQLTREAGRFVLPVGVEMGMYGDEGIEQRVNVDRAFSNIALPAGTLLERPSLSKWAFSKEKLRLFGLAAFLPLLLLAAASVVFNSAPRALLVAAPIVLAVAFAGPALLFSESTVDEITLLAIAAAICCVLPIVIDVVIRAKAATAATYRAVRVTAAPLIVCALAAAALLAIPAFAAEALRSGWRAPLVACVAVLFVSLGSGAVLPAAILIALREMKRRGGSVAHATRNPEEWSRRDPAPLSLGVASLTKTYAGGFRALHRISFELTPGIVGLLGPNGAGKTTLLRTITGLLTPTRGRIVFRGVPVTPENLDAYRHHVGFLPQEFNAYAGLTAEQFLDYWAIERGITDRAFRVAEIERLLALAGLTEHATRRVRDFSGGMRQRIGIARALIGDPALIVVDEPTTGLDIEARAHFRELLLSLAAERIVILSTHIASDVESTASRILVLVRGRLRWDGTPDGLIAAARGRVFEIIAGDAEARALSRRHRITKRVRTPQGIRIRAVVREHDALEGAAVEPTLEEAYLAMASEGDVKVSTFSFLAMPASET